MRCGNRVPSGVVRPTHLNNLLAPQQFSQSENEQTARHPHAVPQRRTSSVVTHHTHTKIPSLCCWWLCVCVSVCARLWLRSVRVGHVHRRNLWHSQLLSSTQPPNTLFRVVVVHQVRIKSSRWFLDETNPVQLYSFQVHHHDDSTVRRADCGQI